MSQQWAEADLYQFVRLHFCFLFNFLFDIGVQMINNVVIVSDVQHTDSCIHSFSNSWPT